MKKSTIISTIFTLLILLTFIVGCSSTEKETGKQLVEVKRGSILSAVTSDGNLVMPHEVKLKFGSPGTVDKIYVEEGDRVKAGKLLAKMDDKLQQLGVMTAQYDIELALNELAERVYPALLGYPHYYPSVTALFRVDQTIKELNDAKRFLGQGNYADTGSSLRVAYHDLKESLNMINAIIIDLETYPDIAAAMKPGESPDDEIPYEQSYHSIPESIKLLQQDLDKINNVIKLLEEGFYQPAASALDIFIQDVTNTRAVVDRICGRIVRSGVHYPDASTSLDVLRQAEVRIRAMQDLMSKENYDTAKLSEEMRIVQHDLAASHNILQDNDLVFKNGVNLKVLRQYNLNFQKAELALSRAKEELMKTEILAPFDGIVVDIGVKENDQLSAYDYSSKTAVHLVDTRTVKMEGVVDEIDIFKVKVGQKAIITLDALADKEFTGKVTFISPFSTQVAGVVNYPVNIMVDKTDTELKGGLTSTANIIVDSRENVLIIPPNAIKGTRKEPYVEVAVNGTQTIVEKRNVVIGIQNESKAEVLSGLKEGEKVLVDKIQSTTKSAF